MRRVDRHPDGRIPFLRRSDDGDRRLRQWLQFEVETAFAARQRLEAVWRESRRQYEGIPRLPVRVSPIPDAPNIEVPVGAIASDSIYAAAIDALFTASPLLVVRHTNLQWLEHAKAVQRWVNWMAANEIDLRAAVNNAFLDNTQLGTGAYYVPFVESVRKTDIHRVTQRGPRMIAIPPENLVMPGSTRDDLQEARWVGLRFFYTPTEMRDRARQNKSWDVSKVMPIAHVDWIRSQREELGHVRSSLNVRELFEFVDIYAYFDYDDDGEDEDLLVTWDRTSNSLVSVTYAPYDKRPIEKMVYQERAHMPYGIGILEMIQPFQTEATELHNHKILNSLLANSRLWVTETGSGVDETMEIWPNKVVKLNRIDKLKQLPMSDVFPQLPAFEASAMSLAESRVGLRGELALIARGGNRTPATTAMTLLQQTNRRFTPAFDSMRLTTGAAVRQAILRYAERAKLGDKNVRRHFEQVLGGKDAELVWSLLRQPDFEESVQIEFTATSATVSREADRQNALLLMNTMGQQHQRIAELVSVVVNPQVPEPIRKIVTKMIEAQNEMFERMLRTFDLVRDPSLFVADVTPELDQLNEQRAAEEAAMGGLGLPQPAAVPGPETPPNGGPPGVVF